MRDIEHQVTQMLHRRSGDIAAERPRTVGTGTNGDGRHPSPRPGEGTGWPDRANQRQGWWGAIPWRQLSIAAALLVVGGTVAITQGGGDDSTVTAAESGPTDPPNDNADPNAESEGRVADEEPAGSVGDTDTTTLGDSPTLDDAIDLLPPGVDVETGSFVYVNPGVRSIDDLVGAYLATRLPDLRPDHARVETVGRLALFRWSVTNDDQRTTGSVIVRNGDHLPGIVAATTDGLVAPVVRRDLARLSVELTDDTGVDDRLVLTITDTFSAPIPDPPGATTLEASAGGDRFAIEATVGADPLVVLAQHVGGTTLSVLEFPVESVGFAASCGRAPPIQIGVGEVLGPLQPGPAPQLGGRPPLDNQQIWHHPGPDTSIEVRWPADPVPRGRIADDELERSEVVHVVESAAPLIDTDGDGEVDPVPNASGGIIGLVGSDLGDPCSVAQISVLGETSTVDWWSGALAAMWAFGTTLDISQLDPAIGPDGPGGTDDTGLADQGLVSGSEPATETPRVAAAGSCDGLPDDPPRTGSPSIGPHPDPEEALAEFLSTGATGLDPPLPAGGYTAVVLDDSARSYITGSASDPIVVINVERTGDGWRVVSWEAAPC